MNEIGNRLVVLILIVALLYIISPVDFVPDPILVFCWADDVAVAGGTLGARSK